MGYMRFKAIRLLEQCDCSQQQEVQEHHLKLSDSPEGSTKLRLGYNGNEYIGWMERKNDECEIVLFVNAGDNTNHYVQETCPSSKEECKKCIQAAIQKLSSYLK